MISFAKTFPDLAVDGDCSDMFAATFYSVKFGLGAANSRLFNIIKKGSLKRNAQGQWGGGKGDLTSDKVGTGDQIHGCLLCCPAWTWNSGYEQYLQQKQVHLVVPKKSMIVVFVRAIGFGTRWFVSSRPASRSNTWKKHKPMSEWLPGYRHLAT